jgi:hypothetical protein
MRAVIDELLNTVATDRSRQRRRHLEAWDELRGSRSAECTGGNFPRRQGAISEDHDLSVKNHQAQLA